MLTSTLEHVIANKFKLEFRQKEGFLVKSRSAQESNSEYLFVTRGRRSACIRVSDHFNMVHPGKVKQWARRPEAKVFYYLTHPGFPAPNIYRPGEEQRLSKEVMEYLSVSSS